MKKQYRMWIVLMLLLTLGGCAAPTSPVVETTAIPKVDTLLPGVSETESARSQSAAVLYYRFLSEPYLAAETRTIVQQAGQSYEFALLGELLTGPGTRSSELVSPFPEGLQVLGTLRQDRTLFVTLSSEIMNGFADEPAAWSSDAYWAQEVPLRRILCLQAMVATVTENCPIDRVQFLVQQENVSGSLRLKQGYYMDSPAVDDNAVTVPVYRDVSRLLTPDKTMEVIFTHWQQQNWSKLYMYLSAHQIVTFQEFVAQLTALPMVTDFSYSAGSVSGSGDAVTYSLGASILGRDMKMVSVSNRMIRLSRENGLWKITLAQLTDWLKELP